eukprot:4328042-Prymnesium_polylepis.1
MSMEKRTSSSRSVGHTDTNLTRPLQQAFRNSAASMKPMPFRSLRLAGSTLHGRGSMSLSRTSGSRSELFGEIMRRGGRDSGPRDGGGDLNAPGAVPGCHSR